MITCVSTPPSLMAILMFGQHVSINGNTNRIIVGINASNPSAVAITLSGAGLVAFSGQVLSFSAPVISPEMQLPTKSPSAPGTGTWLQGDVLQNSGATTAGVCGWVNAGGTSWVTIPCANSAGQISASQVVDTAGTSPECPNGTGGELTTSGCTSPPSPYTFVASSGTVASGTYTSGITATGSSGQYVTLTFPNGTTAQLVLTGTNTIASGTTLTSVSGGTSTLITSPTTAIVSNGSATGTGTPVLSTLLSSSAAGLGLGTPRTAYTITVPALPAGACTFYEATWARAGTYVSAYEMDWDFTSIPLIIEPLPSNTVTNNVPLSSRIKICNNPGTPDSADNHHIPNHSEHIHYRRSNRDCWGAELRKHRKRLS